MTDRVYPSAKPQTTTAAVPPPPNHAPPSKPPTRYHPYRPNPPQNHHKKRHHRQFSCRRCACLTCFWSILILLILLLLAAIAASIFYALYRPRLPLFSVTSLKITNFNLSTTPSDDSTRLTAGINVTVSAKNPNKKIAFLYDPMSITVISDSISLASGSFTNFTNAEEAVSIIHAAMGTSLQVLDADSVNSLQADLKRKRGLEMEIVMDTMVGVKLEKVKMKKIGIRVKCEGIHGNVPQQQKAGKSKTVKVKPAVADTSAAKCKVDLRIKILKWTF